MLMCRYIVMFALILVAFMFSQAMSEGLSDYICGDANSDGSLNVSDAVYMINYVFKGGPAPASGCCAECSEGETEPCYTGPPETEGMGVCQNGTRTCTGGVWGPCVGEIVPQPEVCDGLDNDCDGAVDDGNPDGGGPCSTGQPGVCADGTLHCQGGALVCVPDQSPTPEVCDGLDNDCDGAVDDGDPDSGGLCSTGQPGVCADGTLHCQGGALVCVPDQSPTPEVCDGLDNDCDGVVDDGNPDGGGPCSTGQPGVCAEGTLHCQDGALVCVPDQSPTPEVCDGLDNDCDGAVDDGDPDSGGLCSTGQPGVCAQGTLHCQGGALVCVPDQSPSTEICDGLDNDCDGLVDEGFNVGEPCSVGEGECQEWGVMVCTVDGSGTECSATPGPPATEICDGLDNDCDGLIDEDYNVGEPCSAGLGECRDWGIMVCTVDGLGTECNATPGSPTTEVCDGLDNDCDGQVDEDYNVGEPCSVGEGECQEWGITVCTVDGYGVECSATGGFPTTEICDGLDNDCDGLIDEGFNVGEPCSVGQGECQEWGVMVCTGDGSGTECSASPGSASPEVCDGVDNDCDGLIDEGFNVGEPCTAGLGECQELGIMECTADGSGTECSAVPGTPTAEICNDYLDNDCDGLIDGADPDCP